jgi:flavodoxin
MKLLIVYYSFTGNNEALARKLGERIGCDTLRIEEKKKRTNATFALDVILKKRRGLKEYDVDLSAYDHIILVAPVWAGMIATPMQSFARLENRNLKSYSVIALCGGADGQKENIRAFLESTMSWKPLLVEELRVSDILRAEERDSIMSKIPYKVKEEDLEVFNSKIETFLRELGVSTVKLVPA